MAYKYCRIQNPEANKWIELDIPVKDFLSDGKSPATGDHIQVVTIKAIYPMVYYLYTYTILIDNFSINGGGSQKFVAVKPASVDFNMFDISILNKHFFYGDVLSLTTIPQGKIQLLQVWGKLIDGRNKIVKDNIKFLDRVKSG